MSRHLDSDRPDSLLNGLRHSQHVSNPLARLKLDVFPRVNLCSMAKLTARRSLLGFQC